MVGGACSNIKYKMVKIILHKNLSESELTEIINIKSISWPYSYIENKNWIEKNLNDEDLHFLVYKNDELLSYLNLVKVSVKNNEEKIQVLGVGNVCTKYKGRGDGKVLMEELKVYLKKSGERGLLFCKSQLEDFYNKYGWVKITNIYPKENIITMVFNFGLENYNLNYDDRLF